MPQQPQLTLSTVVLETSDAQTLADFYLRLLGWTVERAESDWVLIKPPDGGTGLSFQSDHAYVRPTWPRRPGDQQMMMHLDIKVDDLDAAAAHAIAAGAVLAEYQPQEQVRVFFDPAGHPFCLWV